MPKKRELIDVVRASSKIFSDVKGQVTIFIIVGIVIVLAIGLVLVLRSEIAQFEPGEIIPSEKGKVENFIVACIEDLGDEALFRIGLQGGYLNVPELIANDGSSHLRLSPMNVVPYWAKGKTVEIPPLEQIKSDIDNHIQDNLKGCLFTTESFNDIYDLVERSPITADTQILDAKVQFNVHWDVEVRNKAGEVVSEVINHLAESPIKLKRLHETATTIIDREMKTLKIEDITQDLIALEHDNVPVAGTALSCTKKEWSVTKAKDTLKDMLHTNIGQLKVKGTEFVEFPEELTYYQNHYVWDLGEEFNEPEVHVTFRFDQNYPFAFAVTPVSGTKMQSSQLGGNDVLSFLCLQTWKFTYDVSYPVLTQLRDETTGYVFNMAFTTHLVQNTPNRDTAYARPSQTFPGAHETNFCSNRNIPMTVKTYELVENKQGVSVREDLGNVDLSFTCLKYSCDMGKTEYDFGNLGFAGVTTNFPYCINGLVEAGKELYKEDQQLITTKANEQVELNLRPLKEFSVSNFAVVQHEFVSTDVIGPAKPLGSDETALVKLTYRFGNDTAQNPFYQTSFVISSTLDQQLLDQPVELFAKADFTYDVEVTILTEDKVLGGFRGEWNVPWNELQSGSQITFHALTKQGAPQEEQFAFIASLQNVSAYAPLPTIS